MKIKTYVVLTECIENGIEAGWKRAHKHDDNPSAEVIKRCIDDAISVQLGEYFDFSDELPQ